MFVILLPDAIMCGPRCHDRIGKVVAVCGYGDVGKGCASAMKAAGARVMVPKIDPICAPRREEGYQVVRLNDVADQLDMLCLVWKQRHHFGDHNGESGKTTPLCAFGHFDNEI